MVIPIDLAPGAALLTSAAGLTAPLWLGLAAITTVIILAWRPFGTLPDAPHHSGAQRAIR